MKTRFAGIRYFAAIRTKEAVAGALLIFIAFTFPGIGNAQERSATTQAPQAQSNPLQVAKSATPVGKIADAPRAGSITDVRIAPENVKVTFTVSTDRLLQPQDFLLDNPARLVLDFPNTINKVAFTQLPVKAASVKRLRVQQFQSTPSPIARIVFDLEEGHGKHEITTNKDGVRLVFYGGNTKAAPAAVVPSSNAAAPTLSASAQPKPSRPAEQAPRSSLIPTASAATLEKAPTAKPRAPEPVAANPISAPARSEQSKPAPAPAPKPATAPVQKTAAAPQKNPVAFAEANLTLARVELPEAAPVAEPKPLQAMPQAETPLVAALKQSADPPLKMASPPNPRFSGQPLTLDLIDIPLVDFFRLMSEEGGINVVMDPGITGRVSIKVVKVPWDQIFEAVLVNHNLDKQVEGSVVRIARKSTLQEEARQQEALKKATLLAADLETRVKRLNYAKATSLVKALEDQKTVRGSIVVEERTNSLVLTDLPSSVARLLELIEALDIPQPQVEIEARIVSATRNFARDIGIQFGFVQGNLERVTVGGPNTFGTIGGTRPSATPSSTFAAGSSTGRGASDDSASESAAVSTGTSDRNKGNYNVNLPATKAFGGIGISVGNIFDTFLLDAAITAGESKGLAKLISQPKVTAQNNSPAVITQGLRFPVPVVANNTVTVQFHNAALTLTVTPQITYEGNVVLDLKVENNSPDFANDVDGIPSIRTSESTTRVLVSDGGTTVIGGILTDDEATEKDQVPGLGSLPVVGNLFKRNAVSRRTQEVLFFVTPRIVK